MALPLCTGLPRKVTYCLPPLATPLSPFAAFRNDFKAQHYASSPSLTAFVVLPAFKGRLVLSKSTVCQNGYA